VIAARDENRVVDFAALHESHSLYAEGAFGIIQECYVLPEYRSQQIGQQLLNVWSVAPRPCRNSSVASLSIKPTVLRSPVVIK